ncbi:TadE/TadG family type IV pilus assembly protein [Mangrovicella endophytica]|uniref:TadE/TadG family type IV pilus assembly protein n=1 Tax=Mangrovicella endophytica TaxID=2066697 RepID=UPI0012FFEFAD|nr:TadE/TadG family type IV pilus assembly protein [Mangrovicella endophytica]
MMGAPNRPDARLPARVTAAGRRAQAGGGTSLLAFLRDKRALGAVEFALIAPFMLILYMTGSEVSIAITLNRKVQHASSTINDLITQSSDVTTDDVNGIFNIAASIVQPYDSSLLKVRVSSIKIDATGKQTVEWSVGRGLTKLAAKSSYVLPTQFSGYINKYIMVAETAYDYTPLGGYGLTNVINMGETSYLNPRLGDKVTCGNCT